MKKTITLSALLLALLTLVPAKGKAQEMTLKGYSNIWITVKAAPQGGGKVAVAATENALKLWRDATDFKQAVSVAEFMGYPMTIYFLFARPADGYSFGGWYYDDGDGEFDIDKDELASDEPEFLDMILLDEATPVYGTQAEAKQGTQPTVSERTVFAYFTRGAVVGMAYHQDEEHANCGSFFIDKVVNEPGDEVTLRAIPNDGFEFAYWKDAAFLGNEVSRDNPYTFTVKGGERLYAYFKAVDAPAVQLPEEGGFKVLSLSQPWVLSDEALKAGAHVVVLEKEDLKRTADGKTYLDMANEEAFIDVSQINGLPTLVYGKGKVDFANKLTYGMARKSVSEALVRYSGDKGATVKGEVTYVYVFSEELGAFIEIGNTDTMVNPDAPTSISVPAGLAYIAIPAFDLTDEEGNIPQVIGLSPETYDRGVEGRDRVLDVLTALPGVKAGTRTIGGQKIYTLSGVEVRQTGKPGVYIVGGRKIVVK